MMEPRPISHRRIRVTNIMTGLVLAAAGAFLASVAWALLTDQPKVDVLMFDTQRVEFVADDGAVIVPRVDGYEQPSVLVGDDVPIRGQRCVSDTVTDPFGATASMWWERLEPDPGFRVQVLTDFDTVVSELGCVPLTFANEMPDQVIGRIIADGEDSRWRITGSVTPELPNTADAHFETEAFLVVNDTKAATSVSSLPESNEDDGG